MDNMPELDSLVARAADLSSKVGFWNSAVLWSLFITAVAAAAIVISQRMAFVRQDQLTDTQGKIALIKEKAAKDTQDNFQIELATQQTRAADAERKLLELQLKIQQRELSKEQQKTLVPALSKITPKTPITIKCVLGDREGCPFAEQIRGVFILAGWNAGEAVYQTAYEGNPVGIFLHVRKPNPNAPPNMKDVPPSANPIQAAFLSIGLTLRDGFVDAIVPTNDSLEIVVGGNPQKYK
jgi:hypothetical protein